MKVNDWFIIFFNNDINSMFCSVRKHHISALLATHERTAYLVISITSKNSEQVAETECAQQSNWQALENIFVNM